MNLYCFNLLNLQSFVTIAVVKWFSPLRERFWKTGTRISSCECKLYNCYGEKFNYVYIYAWGFPGGSDGKEWLQCWRPRFSPRVGKIHWRRKWQPTSVLLPGKSHGQRNLVACSPWGRRVGHDSHFHFLYIYAYS